jgi:hypothetical protein
VHRVSELRKPPGPQALAWREDVLCSRLHGVSTSALWQNSFSAILAAVQMFIVRRSRLRKRGPASGKQIDVGCNPRDLAVACLSGTGHSLAAPVQSSSLEASKGKETVTLPYTSTRSHDHIWQPERDFWPHHQERNQGEHREHEWQSPDYDVANPAPCHTHAVNHVEIDADWRRDQGRLRQNGQHDPEPD